MKKRKVVLRSAPRGQGVVDYLMVTAVVAAVAVPIIQIYFGDQLRESLFNKREELVTFIAQTPKRPVPNLWFAQDRQGTTGGKGTLNDPKNLEDPK